MYPRIYERNETDFSHNGYGFLKDLIKCEVIEEDNGMFELEGECTVSSFLFEHIQEENIIKAWASDELGEQLFRIYRVQKDLDGYITFNAQHITYDLLDNFIESIELVDTTCENAINEIFNHCAYKTLFKGYSDITHKGNIILQRVNPMEAIKGIRGSVCDTFGNGAKVIKDNFNIRVNSKRGSSNNVLIAYKKNLTGFESELDASDIVTVIFPYATIQRETGAEGETEEEVIQLPEKYIYSEYHKNYNNLKIMSIDFSGDDVESIENLRTKANKYLKNSNRDVPKINYKVEFIPLSKTVNYADYKVLETVSMCDKVIVRDYRFNLDVEAQVIKTIHCSLTQKLLSCELGNFKHSLSDVINDISKEQVEITDRIDKIKIDLDNETGKIKVVIKDEIQKLEGNITQTAQELESKFINADKGLSSQITQTAQEINLKVSNLDGKYTELKQTVEGIDIAGVVTFNDLKNSGSTVINGSNITTGTINADKVSITNIDADNISSGTIKGIEIISTTDNSNRVAMVGDGHYYYAGTKLAGEIHYDSNGGGTQESAKDRFLITSKNGYVLKLQSSGNMSVEANGTIYLTSDTQIHNAWLVGTIRGKEDNWSIMSTGYARFNGINSSAGTNLTNLSCSGDIVANANTYLKGTVKGNNEVWSILSTGYGYFNGINSTSASNFTSISCSGSISTSSTLTCSSTFTCNGIARFNGTIYGYDSNFSVMSNGYLYCAGGQCDGAWYATGRVTGASLFLTNGTAVASDGKIKTNISYLNGNETQTTNEGNEIITTKDMCDFIENIPLARYELKEEYKTEDITHYGFIIQDIINTKVGKEMVLNSSLNDEYLCYSQDNFITIICGALQEEIKKRKDLEEKVSNLLDNMN